MASPKTPTKKICPPDENLKRNAQCTPATSSGPTWTLPRVILILTMNLQASFGLRKYVPFWLGPRTEPTHDQIAMPTTGNARSACTRKFGLAGFEPHKNVLEQHKLEGAPPSQCWKRNFKSASDNLAIEAWEPSMQASKTSCFFSCSCTIFSSTVSLVMNRTARTSRV